MPIPCIFATWFGLNRRLLPHLEIAIVHKMCFAASSLVMLSSGQNWSPTPPQRFPDHWPIGPPGAYQALVSTSLKGVTPWEALRFAPAIKESIFANSALVTSLFGEKVVSVMPFTIPNLC